MGGKKEQTLKKNQHALYTNKIHTGIKMIYKFIKVEENEHTLRKTKTFAILQNFYLEKVLT